MSLLKKSQIALLAMCSASFLQAQVGNSNSVRIDPTDTQADIIRKAITVVPHKRQYDWQKNELTCFVHFGLNTFNGVEWGNGKESPADFNPSSLDAKQWAKVMKEAGMKMAIITAKHHDGFCLWPSRYTDHSVKSSPWKSGQGNVVKEFVDACRAEGIKIGFYLSPADLFQIESPQGCYGKNKELYTQTIPSLESHQKNVSKTYTYDNLTDYDVYFMDQLYELLTEYGDVEEVWFDGAHPKPGTGQTYNRKAWYDMIRQLQPTANIAIKGPDIRWCGNEAGHTRKSEWSVVPINESPEACEWNDMTGQDLGSREKIKDAKYLVWYPSETDVSIRQGWFYRDDKQYVRSTNDLLDLWYRAVGGNCVFLLNITPDKRGLIPAKDSTNLSQMGRIIRESFADNLAKKAQVTTDGVDVMNILTDLSDQTSWIGKEKPEAHIIELQWNNPQTFNCVLMQEDIAKYSQRIEKYSVEALIGNKWKKIASGETVGYKGILRFPTVTSKFVRIIFDEVRVAPTLTELGIYNVQETLSNPLIERSVNGKISISGGSTIRYTLDGTEPTANSPLYSKPFAVAPNTIVKARIYSNGLESGVAQALFGYAKKGWKVKSTSNTKQTNLLADENPATIWISEQSDKNPGVVIDLNSVQPIKGFQYLPRADKSNKGAIINYNLLISNDGKIWKPVIEKGEFKNIRNNPMLQNVLFPSMENARYIKLESLNAVDQDTNGVAIAEFGVL